jgi:outer membrane lipoprotein-sorting protein
MSRQLTSLLFLALVLFAGFLSSSAQAADSMPSQAAISAKPKLACACEKVFFSF